MRRKWEAIGRCNSCPVVRARFQCWAAWTTQGPHLLIKDSPRKTSLGMNSKKKPAMGRIIWRHRQKLQICSAWFLALWLNLGYLQTSRAGIDAGEFAESRDLQSALGEYFNDWFKRVDETQAVQPHWIAPLVTTTPLLTELYRYDQNWEHLSNGAGNVRVFNGGKGLELIPAKTIQLVFGLPPYEQRSGKNAAHGIGDYPFLLIKNRFLSANEENGNYVLTGFLAFSAPVGSHGFTTNNFAITPTIAAGKGWGNFDMQLTFGGTFPTGDAHTLGTPLLTNLTFQYHLLELLWPEVEVNYTYWPNGANSGKNQVFLTTGVVLGRIRLSGRKTLTVGAGYQFAVSHDHPQFDNNWILSVRTNF
jgi:hypothetical protein